MRSDGIRRMLTWTGLVGDRETQPAARTDHAETIIPFSLEGDRTTSSISKALLVEAGRDAERLHRGGAAALPDHSDLDASFHRALLRVLIEAETTVGLLPAILRIQLRREYERELRRRFEL